ncbi:hypothetical protein ACHAXS_002579 [Conticribra weissflogii]
MCWMVTLDLIDIATKVSLLSSHSALQHEDNMDAAMHIMAYLGLHHNSCLCMDPTYPDIDDDQFPVIDWKEFYENVTEHRTYYTQRPKAPGQTSRHMHVCRQQPHGGKIDQIGFLIYTNTALIDCHLKQQATTETGVVCAEFVAMKMGIDML